MSTFGLSHEPLPRSNGTSVPPTRTNQSTTPEVDGMSMSSCLSSPGGSITFRFHARDAHLVLSRNSSAPIPFHVRLDCEQPGSAHAVDVDEQGNGVLDEGRLYQLVRQPAAVMERTLEITFDEPGAEAYVFTFG